MRNIICGLLLSGAVSVLLAANPMSGKWKLNPSKSHAASGTIPKEETMIIEDQGDHLRVTITGTEDDGTPISVQYLVPASGGSGVIEIGTAVDAVDVNNVDANTTDTTYKKGGTKVGSTHTVESKDGKTLTVTTKGADSSGKKQDSTMTFDRQQQ